MWSAVSVLVVLLAGTASTAATAPGAIVVPPCAQTGPCVVVEVVTGEDQQVGDLHYFYADQVIGQADIADASYPVKGGTAVSVKPGSSLSRLVSTVVPDLGAVTYADVVWDDAYQRHLLTGAELRPGAGAGFRGGLVPAFYSTDPDTPQRFTYIRPQRTADDDNGAPGPDQGTRFTDLQGSFLVRVHLTGSVLSPRVTATPTDATNRTYTLSTDQTGPGVTYGWVLPDGSRSTEASPTFTFPTASLAGTYPVSVGVGTADGSFGWGSTSLQAGDAPTPTAASSGPGGVGTASRGPRKNPTATRSADPNPRPTGSTGTPQASPTAPSIGSPGTPGPAATDAPGSLAPRPSEATSTAPTTTTPTTEAPAATGDQVSGILLAGAEPVDPVGAADSQVTADPPPSPSARPLGTGPLRISAAVWVSGGVLLLLLLGVASESGLTLARLRRWSRMAR